MRVVWALISPIFPMNRDLLWSESRPPKNVALDAVLLSSEIGSSIFRNIHVSAIDGAPRFQKPKCLQGRQGLLRLAAIRFHSPRRADAIRWYRRTLMVVFKLNKPINRHLYMDKGKGWTPTALTADPWLP